MLINKRTIKIHIRHKTCQHINIDDINSDIQIYKYRGDIGGDDHSEKSFCQKMLACNKTYHVIACNDYKEIHEII